MVLSFFDLIFLVPIIIIGILCVFTDLKSRKIYNKVILFGFLYGLTAFLFFIFNDYNEEYIIKALVNFIISISVSYALWFYNCWSAGDAKLFSLFCFLLPLSFYEKANYPFFPSFNILINLFIPVIVLFLFLSLIGFLKEKNKKKVIKVLIDRIIGFFKFSFVYIFIFLLFYKIFEKFNSNILIFDLLHVVFIFLTVRVVRNFLSNRFFLNYGIIFLTIGYSFFLIFLGQEEILKNVFFKVYFVLGIIFLLKTFIDNYVNCDEDESKKNENKKFAFSIFIFLAIIITILLKGSLLILVFKYI